MTQFADLPSSSDPQSTPTAEPLASDPLVYSSESDLPAPPTSVPGAQVGTADASTTQEVKEQAGEVAGTAREAAGHVAEVGKEQASQVAGEATRQARDLAAQGRDELHRQATTQQQRLAESLRTLADDLHAMALRSTEQSSASGLVRQAGDHASTAASWLEGGSSEDLLDDVRRFARQRPAAFLGLSAAAGVFAGRFGRGLKDGPAEPSQGQAV